MLKSWDNLPDFMQIDEVLICYDILKRKKVPLFIKRLFDILFSVFLLLLLSPLFLVISILIIFDSKGGVFYRQERVTQYGRVFKIFKFRTMIPNAENYGSQVTVSNDNRVTKIGKFLRKYRLDEIPQLINILIGDMTFVGTRPEVKKYVDCYKPEMFTTLLLPAGVTSEASINYKDEEKLLNSADDADDVYINIILPEKMKYNINSIKSFSLLKDIQIIINTLVEVLK